MRMMRALWAYRGFILGSVRREFQSKYSNSLLGAAWTVINPLAMIVVYTVIFSQVMQAKLPGVDSKFAYSIYLCAGVLTWTFFAEVVSRTQNVFLEQANLLKKISIPRLCLPVIVVANASPANILPAFMQKIISYNPMTSLIGAYQDILVHAKWPDWSSLITVSVLAVLLCIWGMRLFRNHAGEMVDEL